ncbi:MAG: hypothetical protein KDI44_19195 [Thiothrix sp.]|nr:hypothetical protein [Thiothrix sp.]HPQ95128.1 hypothetical protein [Thiolinea sp.]
MRLDNSGLLWAMTTLANQGHPDPEGLIARMESAGDTGNITGISRESARAVGISNPDEPVMSLFAASQYDAQTGKRYRISDSTRATLNQRLDNAIMSGAQPANPFLDAQGFLKLRAGPKRESVPVSDEKLLQHIYTLMDEVI